MDEDAFLLRGLGMMRSEEVVFVVCWWNGRVLGMLESGSVNCRSDCDCGSISVSALRLNSWTPFYHTKPSPSVSSDRSE